MSATLEPGEPVSGDYLLPSEGKNSELAGSIGLEGADAGGIEVDSQGRSSEDRVYVICRSTRPSGSGAIMSAGDGAKAPLDILAREAGEDVQDWDTPPKD